VQLRVKTRDHEKNCTRESNNGDIRKRVLEFATNQYKGGEKGAALIKKITNETPNGEVAKNIEEPKYAKRDIMSSRIGKGPTRGGNLSSFQSAGTSQHML
jgi:hypothetical protein